MVATKILHEKGQSVWLDDITRAMLESGDLARYISEFAMTGLTSNPMIFQHGIKSDAYEAALPANAAQVKGEQMLTQLAIEDLRRAADLLLPVHERTDGVDGWVSLELSPRLAHDAEGTIAAAHDLYERASQPQFLIPNLLIKIPGTAEGLVAIEESVAAGIPINATLLFSADQYRAASEAYVRGVERRVARGLNPRVPSVASLLVSRWDEAANPHLPDELKNRLGLAVGRQVYRAYRQLMESDRWQRLQNEGARMQRLLFGSTGVREPGVPETFYVRGLFAPFTIVTMPERTLLAAIKEDQVTAPLPVDGGRWDDDLAEVRAAGIDVISLASQLQQGAVQAFARSWRDALAKLDAS